MYIATFRCASWCIYIKQNAIYKAEFNGSENGKHILQLDIISTAMRCTALKIQDIY